MRNEICFDFISFCRRFIAFSFKLFKTFKRFNSIFQQMVCYSCTFKYKYCTDRSLDITTCYSEGLSSMGMCVTSRNFCISE
uniref:Candidate secreted effector n=1 Tax=Meloidogyne incognita TaxID=6306 RepID=A0A914N6V5_MELIC